MSNIFIYEFSTPYGGFYERNIYMDFYSHSLEDNAATENDDDEGSIDSWAEEIINTDLPVICHISFD